MREGFDGDAEGAVGDEANVGRDVDRWVDDARLGTEFVEKEGECSGSTCEGAEGEVVEEYVEGEEKLGSHVGRDEKRDKNFGAGWP